MFGTTAVAPSAVRPIRPAAIAFFIRCVFVVGIFISAIRSSGELPVFEWYRNHLVNADSSICMATVRVLTRWVRMSLTCDALTTQHNPLAPISHPYPDPL
jgi:hypothetical protein